MTEQRPPYIIDVNEVLRVDQERRRPIVVMIEHRCEKCGRLIARGQVNDGLIEIKCRCNHIQIIAA